MNIQGVSLRAIGLAGAVFFGMLLSFTFVIPGWVEDFAANFIEREVAEQLDEAIDNFEPKEGESRLARVAGALYAKNQAGIEDLKANLKAQVHEEMADSLARVRNLDCECRDKYAAVFEQGFKFDIALLQASNDRIVDFIQSKYMQVAAELKRDLRVFTGSNLVLFLLLLLVSFLKPGAVRHLFLPGVLLAIAAVICSYFYIFEQDWLLTIIYSNYLGFAYLVYLGVVFLFLCDIVFNRGRVTAEIINGILNALGSAASLAPC